MKKRKLLGYATSLLMIGGLLFFSHCGPLPCLPNSEPLARVYFRTSKNYTSISTINPKIVITPGINSIAEDLPISLSNDQLTFVFVNSTRSDTLSFAYKRNFKFESQRCGYVVAIENFRLVVPTSFKDTRVENSGVSSFSSASNQISIYVND
jgi:Family of unknown function (DUF6452)